MRAPTPNKARAPKSARNGTRLIAEARASAQAEKRESARAGIAGDRANCTRMPSRRSRATARRPNRRS